MGEKIVVGPITHGLQDNVLPFNIENDAFSQLINAQSWRGRVRRKRGNQTLGRVKRYFDSTKAAFNRGAGTTTQITLDASGTGNLLTGFTDSDLESNSSLVAGSLSVVSTSGNTYTDSAQDGTLSGFPSGSGTIDYSTGAIDVGAGEASKKITATFNYYPNLPLLGLSTWNDPTSSVPATLAFDSSYAYNVAANDPYTIHDVSFYYNTSTTSKNPFRWNGQNYQQFWSTNYEGSLWVTNGVTVSFDATNIGLPSKTITAISNNSGTSADLTITSHGLQVGDSIFVNEITTATGMNFQTGTVTDVPGVDTVTVSFPDAAIAGSVSDITGIAIYLTNQPDATKDCMKYYPSSPIGSDHVFVANGGWVNYCPPVSLSSYAAGGLSPGQYYLVTCKMVVQFKDRLLFIGPVVQTRTGTPIYLEDTVMYTENGTPYYTASFQYATIGVNPVAGDFVTASFTPYLVPTNSTSNPAAAFEDLGGFGGYIAAGFNQAITSVSTNDDVLIMGFSQNTQARFYYTSNDIIPFNFYAITGEYGTRSTFSAINFDQGVISVGTQGFIVTDQTASQRMDIMIPDKIFQFSVLNNGAERVCAARDYINEWIYFTYPTDNDEYSTFPSQTLLYNYRNNTWCIYNETFTCYGTFRKNTGENWGQLDYFNWSEWTDPWGSGEENLLQPEVIAGNAQGYIQVRAEGTQEGVSGYIQSISSNTITSPNHCLNDDDYIIISGALGAVGSEINGNVYRINVDSANTFIINTDISDDTYSGQGEFTRIYNPLIQSKAFPVGWQYSRKTRLGPQQYLFTGTSSGQVTIQIFLSQNINNAWNLPPIVPSSSPNESLVYSNVISTALEPNNLQSLVGESQDQIWHRMNTGLIGDTVQIAVTMNEDQLTDSDLIMQFEEIELHSFILDVSPAGVLA